MNKSELTADLIGAAVLMAVGLTMAIMAVDYDLFGRNGLIRPGFMPFLAGGFMALFGVVIAFSAFRQHRAYARSRGAKPAAEPETGAVSTSPDESQERERADGEADGNGTFNKRVATVFGLTFVTILAAPVLGFILAFGLLIFVLLVFVERERLWIGVVVSGLASFSTWLVFVYFLRIPLPSGIF